MGLWWDKNVAVSFLTGSTHGDLRKRLQHQPLPLPCTSQRRQRTKMRDQIVIHILLFHSSTNQTPNLCRYTLYIIGTGKTTSLCRLVGETLSVSFPAGSARGEFKNR